MHKPFTDAELEALLSDLESDRVERKEAHESEGEKWDANDQAQRAERATPRTVNWESGDHDARCYG